MRIAVAAHSATRAGGVETYLSSVVPALAARGHEVACWFESTVDAHASVLPASSPGPVWIASPGATDSLRPLREWKPDVIYHHGLRSVALERELTTIAPVAFFAHSYYGACISGEKYTRFPILSPCGRTFGPACLAHYLPRRCGGLSPLTMLRDYETQSRKRDLLRAYDAVLVASRYMSSMYAAQGLETTVVPLPAAFESGAQERRRRADAPWNLLFLGRLERSKGVSIALRSSAMASQMLGTKVRLVVGGEGSRAGELRRQAATLTAASSSLAIDFPGWLTDDARAAALREADLLLVPSLWPEPFGLVGVEAATAGLPSIAFDVGGIRDWLSDGVNGRLVGLGGDRVRRFAGAIVSTLSDCAALQRMKEDAVQLAQRFTMATHVAALEPILQKTAARARPAVSISQTA